MKVTQRKVSCTKQHDYFLVYPYLEGKSDTNTSVLAAWGAGDAGVGWSGGWDGLPSASLTCTQNNPGRDELTRSSLIPEQRSRDWPGSYGCDGGWGLNSGRVPWPLPAHHSQGEALTWRPDVAVLCGSDSTAAVS